MSLILKRNGPDDYLVLTGNFHIGRIYYATNIADHNRWLWFLNGIMGNAGSAVALSGAAPSPEAAKEEIASAFQSWLAWAGLREADGREGH